jgi:hypothetical protein
MSAAEIPLCLRLTLEDLLRPSTRLNGFSRLFKPPPQGEQAVTAEVVQG